MKRSVTALPVVCLASGAIMSKWFADLSQDLRDAARTLTRQRVFAAAAVLMLALGIGANSAMFALVDAVLLRPLPFPDPDRLVKVWERTPTSAQGPVSPI